MSANLSSEEALQILVERSDRVIDVRSEKEFQQGHFAGVTCLPILNNEHRHLVGLTYKREGQEAAIKLGHQLVNPFRPTLQDLWHAATIDGQGVVMCWRGGMRSKIACDWMRERGMRVRQVEGGYKSVRRHAMKALETPPPLLVLAGFTGSRKTELLHDICPHIDLEAITNHRGSSFGYLVGQTQPAQATFENNLALAYKRLERHKGPILIEDESRNLGRCFLPASLNKAIATSPIVWLEVPLEQRAQNIMEDYVLKPLSRGLSKTDLHAHYSLALKRIRSALGNELMDQLAGQIDRAFASDDHEAHLEWIAALLDRYYDKRYSHACERHDRHVVYCGSRADLVDYLKQAVKAP